MIAKLLKSDYSFNLINKIYTILVGLLSSAFLTRYLGVVYKGDYAYITQIAVVATIILNIGMNQSYSFFYRKNKGNVLGSFINIYALQFLLNLILAVTISWYFKNSLYIYAIILIPFNLALQEIESTMAVENIRLKIKLHMLNVTVKMISFLCLYVFINKNLWAPIIVTIIINSFTVIVYLVNSKIRPKPQNINFKFFHDVVNYSWIPMITSLLVMLNYSVDIFFLKHLGSSIELGLYSVAVGIINYFWLIPDSFKEVLVSKIARNYKTNSTLLALKISVATVIIVIGAFVIFGRDVIAILYGSEFTSSYFVTLILSIGAISMVYFKMIGVVLLAEGKRWIFFFILLFSVVANVVLNIITIPIYGMYGAALSSVVSYSVSGIAFVIYFAKDKNLKLKDVIFFNYSEITILKKIIEGAKNVEH